MTPSEFFARVLPEDGRFVLANLRKPRPYHVFVTSHADLISEIEKRGNETTLYFAVASYRDQDRRTASNVHSLRCLRLDVDCGEAKFQRDPEHAYPTRDDGVAALVAFTRQAALTPSIIVSSGEGLHVYYCFDEDIGPSGWSVLADRLKALTRTLGFKADPVVTADPARVLRPPGTLHPNGRRVAVLRATSKNYSVAELNDLLPPAEDDPLATPPPVGRTGVNADILDAGPDDRPASLARVADHCQVVRILRDSHGNVPEPHWRACAGVAKFCNEDGEALFHEWSSGYSGYSRREAQGKLDHWDTGPTTCRHFEDTAGKCDGCPHKGRITSPVQLGRAPRAPQPLTPEQAEGLQPTADCPVPSRPDLFSEESDFFFRKDEDGKWVLWATDRLRNKDEEGNTIWDVVHVPVATRLFWLDHATATGGNEGGGVMVELRVLTNNHTLAVESHSIRAGEIDDERLLTRQLLDRGVSPDGSTKDSRQRIRQYLLRENKRIMENLRPVSRGRFGFQQHDGAIIATLGNVAILPDGSLQAAMCGKSLKPVGNTLGPSGLPPTASGKWGPGIIDSHVVPHAKLYVQHLADHFCGPEAAIARLAISIGLAAPLMVFTADDPYVGQPQLPPTGLVVSLYSNASGRGKSAVLHAIAAAYGNLSQVRAGSSKDLTANSLETLAKLTANYPFLLDEVSRNDMREVSEMIYRFANGTGKIRLSRDGTLREPAVTWAFPCLVSTNAPQRELIEGSEGTAEAMHMRLLELNFDAVPKREFNAQYAESIARVSPYFGNWGTVLMSRIVRDLEAARTLVRDSVSEAFDMLGNQVAYRFFARTFGTVLAMFKLMADLIPFSKEEVTAVFRECVTDVTSYMARNARTPVTLFNDFINSVSEHIAVTNTMDDGSVVQNLTKLRAPILGREARNEGVLWVSPKALTKFCQERNTSRAQVEREWAAAGLLTMNGKSARWPINPFRGLPFAARETECLKLVLQQRSAGAVVPMRSAAA